jgi:hypothetical protein
MISAQTTAMYKESIIVASNQLLMCIHFVGLGIVISDHNRQLAIVMTRFFGLFLDMNHTSICGFLKVLHFDLEMLLRSIVLVVHSTSCY